MGEHWAPTVLLGPMVALLAACSSDALVPEGVDGMHAPFKLADLRTTEPIVVRGRFVDADGRPFVGFEPALAVPLEVAGRTVDWYDAPRKSELRTDADGRFEGTFDPPAGLSEIRVGLVFEWGRSEVAVVPRSLSEEALLQLENTRQVSVRVRHSRLDELRRRLRADLARSGGPHCPVPTFERVEFIVERDESCELRLWLDGPLASSEPQLLACHTFDWSSADEDGALEVDLDPVLEVREVELRFAGEAGWGGGDPMVLVHSPSGRVVANTFDSVRADDLTQSWRAHFDGGFGADVDESVWRITNAYRQATIDGGAFLRMLASPDQDPGEPKYTRRLTAVVRSEELEACEPRTLGWAMRDRGIGSDGVSWFELGLIVERLEAEVVIDRARLPERSVLVAAIGSGGSGFVHGLPARKRVQSLYGDPILPPREKLARSPIADQWEWSVGGVVEPRDRGSGLSGLWLYTKAAGYVPVASDGTTLTWNEEGTGLELRVPDGVAERWSEAVRAESDARVGERRPK